MNCKLCISFKDLRKRCSATSEQPYLFSPQPRNYAVILQRYHSTETALVKIQNGILLGIDQEQCVLVFFLDLSAAFDTVDH